MTAKPSAQPRPAPGGTQVVRSVRKATAVGVRQGAEGIEPAGAGNTWARDLLHHTPSWLASMLVHLVILLLLAVLTLPADLREGIRATVLCTEADGELEDLDPPVDLPLSPDVEPTFDEPAPAAPHPASAAALTAPAGWGDPMGLRIGLAEFGLGFSDVDLLAPVGGPDGPGTSLLQRRRKGPRPTTPEGRAVAAALKWLAGHQLPDGGWSFDHAAAPRCGGQCRNPGKLAEARVAATALALLPFLGAGQTHQSGKYRTTVTRGLYFLVSRMQNGPTGGSLYEPGGRMYSHGIAAIALCEAYALTHDKGLCLPAQQALNFICYAQDPVGGGWRYEPRQPGDTSVVGWQIMALKSGHLAYLYAPPTTAPKASAYLDGVQYESGARYGYTDAGRGSPATTAIGLLCRMHLGWKKDNPALQRGVRWIGQQGPDPNDMYYNYYAAQVMRHWEGEPWDRWDAVMKPQLVNSQSTAGHEAGSWHFNHTHADRGGRLYGTAMAAMTLEVYYRYLPIYGRQSIEEDFPE